MASRIPGVGIKALTDHQLQELIVRFGEPRFRATQLTRWLYGRGAEAYEDMTDLPVGLRQRLSSDWPLATPTPVERHVSDLDDTRKYLWRLEDGTTVESVGLPTGDRLTVCFSTQAGCAMGCSFCATGAAGLARDLGAGEMVDQVRLVGQDFGQRVSNAVAMGQGEPFANYEATLGALRLLNSPDGMGIGARHITVSTCGLLAGIARFSQEPEQFTLAVSLHSAIQSSRDTLMPGVRKHPLPELRTALEDYIARTSRRVTFEYALIAGVNDDHAHAQALVQYCRGLLCHVNLIPMNANSSDLVCSDRDTIALFRQTLAKAGIEATMRTERGADIHAACGQLKQYVAKKP